MISVIIPTYNEEKNIGKLLSDLKNQTYKNFEVIVIDDFSTDKTVEIAKKFGAKIFFSGKHNLSYSRNLGIKKARGNILVNLDADFRINNKFLEEVNKCFKNTDAKGVKVAEKLSQDSLLEKLDYLRSFYKHEGFTLAVRVFKKGIFYDEDLKCFGEDVVINRKIKGGIAYCKKAKIAHHRFHSWRELINSWKKYPSVITFIKKYEGNTNLWKWFIPLFFPLFSPIVTLHRIFKFKKPISLLIPIYDFVRALAYIYGFLDYI